MKPGFRSDLKNIKDLIEHGSSEIEIADQYFSRWIVYRRSFAAYRDLLSQPRGGKTQVIVLHGGTGTGKTSWVYGQPYFGPLYVHTGSKWFDGYFGQPRVLFDDFYGEEHGVSWGLLLRLLDRYPMQVEVKGGFVEWAPDIIYITSNKHPSLWYTMNWAPLERRIDFLFAK